MGPELKRWPAGNSVGMNLAPNPTPPQCIPPGSSQGSGRKGSGRRVLDSQGARPLRSPVGWFWSHPDGAGPVCSSPSPHPFGASLLPPPPHPSPTFPCLPLSSQPRPTTSPAPGSQKALERLLSLRQEGVLKSQEGKTVKLNPPRPSPRGRGWHGARTDITWELPQPAAATRLLGGRALAI